MPGSFHSYLLGAEASGHSDKLHGDPHRAEFEEHVLLKGITGSVGDQEGLSAASLERPQGSIGVLSNGQLSGGHHS